MSKKRKADQPLNLAKRNKMSEDDPDLGMAIPGGLRRWVPMLDLPEDEFSIIMYGTRGSGKTTMLRQILFDMYERIKDHEIYLISNTAAFNTLSDAYSYVPKCATCTSMGEIGTVCQAILDKQEERWKGVSEDKPKKDKPSRKKEMPAPYERDVKDPPKKEKKEGKKSKKGGKELVDKSGIGPPTGSFNEEKKEEPRRVLLIMDDVVHENAIRFCEPLNEISISGRHYKISQIILSQGISGSQSVPPIVRNTTNFLIVVQNPSSAQERKMFSDWYLQKKDDKESKGKGLDLMGQVTEVDYRAFVVDRASRKREFVDYCFAYGPVPDPFPVENFRLGTPEQWLQDMKMEQETQERAKAESEWQRMELGQAQAFALNSGTHPLRNYEIPFSNPMFKSARENKKLVPASKWQVQSTRPGLKMA